MADGEKYEVSDQYKIALGRTTVIVVGNDACAPPADHDRHQLLESEAVAASLLTRARVGAASALVSDEWTA